MFELLQIKMLTFISFTFLYKHIQQQQHQI